MPTTDPVREILLIFIGLVALIAGLRGYLWYRQHDWLHLGMLVAGTLLALDGDTLKVDVNHVMHLLLLILLHVQTRVRRRNPSEIYIMSKLLLIQCQLLSSIPSIPRNFFVITHF